MIRSMFPAIPRCIQSTLTSSICKQTYVYFSMGSFDTFIVSFCDTYTDVQRLVLDNPENRIFSKYGYMYVSFLQSPQQIRSILYNRASFELSLKQASPCLLKVNLNKKNNSRKHSKSNTLKHRDVFKPLSQCAAKYILEINHTFVPDLTKPVSIQNN